MLCMLRGLQGARSTSYPNNFATQSKHVTAVNIAIHTTLLHSSIHLILNGRSTYTTALPRPHVLLPNNFLPAIIPTPLPCLVLHILLDSMGYSPLDESSNHRGTILWHYK